jgi:hypothetical protein
VPFFARIACAQVGPDGLALARPAVIALRKKLSHQRAPFKQMKAELWSKMKFG